MTRVVLVVDDEADIRAIARVALETIAGWRMIEATSGDQALAALAGGVPDAVLMDHLLTGEDGLMVAARLRQEAGLTGVPILMMSAASTAPTSDDVDGFIAKPFNPRTLAAQISAAAGWNA